MGGRGLLQQCCSIGDKEGTKQGRDKTKTKEGQGGGKERTKGEDEGLRISIKRN